MQREAFTALDNFLDMTPKTNTIKVKTCKDFITLKFQTSMQHKNTINSLKSQPRK